jgi:predicted  nucleic acid-binding Zn-ribbon protein
MKKLDLEQINRRIKNKNPFIKIIGKYINIRTKSEMTCLKCGNIFLNSAERILNSVRTEGCKKCQKRKKNRKVNSRSKTHETYIEEVVTIWGDKITILSQYDTGEKKIEAKCNLCENKWKTSARNIIRGHGCPKCSHKTTMSFVRKDHGVFSKEIEKIYDGKITLLSKYTIGNNQIECKCNLCGNRWRPKAQSLIRRGCPKCNLSKGEMLIENILKELKLDFRIQYIIDGLKTDKKGTPKFDFAIFREGYITDIVEYDGYHHFHEVKNWGGEKRLLQQKEIDDFKNQYCLKNNIKIHRIPYFDLNKIDIEYISNILHIV